MAKTNGSAEPEKEPEGPAEEQNPQPRGLGRVKGVEALQLATMVGDVRDLILQEMRDAKNALPWTVRSEAEQREMIERANTFARNIVRRIAQEVASQSNPSIACKVERYQVDSKGLKVLLSGLSTPENIDAMVDGGSLGHLVFLDTEALAGEREPIQALPDQPQLGDDDDGGPIFDQTPSGKGGPKPPKPPKPPKDQPPV